jgi:predicted ester cyclase
MPAPELDTLYCRFIDYVNRRRLDQLDGFLAADVIEHAPHAVVGIAAIREMRLRWLAAFPDLHLVIEDLVVEGDHLMARLRMSGTHRGPLAGMEPTDRRVGVTVFDAWSVHDGQCVERWVQLDMLELLRQLRA